MKNLQYFLKENNKKIEDLDTGDWINISYQCELSEEFIRKYKNKVNWYYISWKQNLSEGFIREFKDKVNWYYISKYQKLSKGFILEFKNSINFNYIIPCFYSESFQSKIKSSWRYKRL